MSYFGTTSPDRTRILLFLTAVALLLAAGPASAAVYPTGFEETEVVDGLTRPTAVAWAPDGRMFIAEKDGALKVLAPGAPSAQLVKDYSGRVNSHWDRGLLGIAVDSQFAQQPYLYLLYTYDLAPLTPDSSSPMVSQLLRVKIGANNAVLEETPILGTSVGGVCPAPSQTVDCIPSEGASHSIGTVRSAPDGTLWVGSGDAASFSAVDPLALRTYNEASMAGKLMHVDRNGQGLPWHPFCPANSNLAQVCTKLHAKGFRNPFRFSLRPDGAAITLGDVGWNSREEIDIVPTGPGTGGRSYGWPCYEGNIQTPGYKDLAACAAEYPPSSPSGKHTTPDYAYSHVGSSASVGGPVYTGAEFPAAYSGATFVADYGQKFIKYDPPGGAFAPVSFATNWVGVSLDAEPGSGDLVYASVGDFGGGNGSIRRISYAPGNARPQAVLEPAPLSGSAPLEVDFDASGSSDPDGDPLAYTLDFGDGSPASHAESVSHTYSEVGSYEAELTVCDDRGKCDTDAAQISAGNDAPELELAAPPTYRAGEPFTVSGSATDAQDGELDGDAFTWDVRIVHGTHDHIIHAGETGTTELEVDATTDHDADSHYEVSVTVEDSEGIEDHATARLDPETTTVTLTSEPSGAVLSYGGSAYTTPRSLTSAIGFETTLSAPLVFDLAGLGYEFDSWGDGGERVRPLTVPEAGGAYVARYRATGTPPTPPAPPGPPVPPAPPSGPPPGGGPPSPRPVDRSGPRVLLYARPGGRLLHGRAADPAGIRRVAFALRRSVGKGRCTWWLAGPDRMTRHASSCARPRWIAARLDHTERGARFALRLDERPPPGTYRVLVRAADRAGNQSRLRALRTF